MRFLTLGVVAVLASLVSAQTPLPPGQDPFYVPPAGFENTAPGTILRSRSIVPGFIGLLPDPVESWQVLYRTTAVNGSAIATATTIFKPLGATLDRFLSFHTAEDSSALICAPSYNYQLFSNQTDAIVSFEFLLLQVYLGAGYIVSSPDYEGPDAAFGPGHLEGRGVLDSMRAVNNFATTLGLQSSNNAIVGLGYSGGAIATGWAAALQRTYAPELNVKGWSAGGTPANLTGTMLYIDNTIWSGFLPAAIDGLLKPSAYGAQLTPVIDSIITPYGRSLLDFGNNNCAVQDLLNASDVSILSYKVQSLGPNLPYQPTIQQVLQQQTLGINKTETPIAPVFMYHSKGDEIIPYSNATTLYKNWCAHGADVHFTTLAVGGHATGELFGIPDVLNFIHSAFAGTLTKGCSQNTELLLNLDVNILGAELVPLLTAVKDALPVLAKADSGDLNALVQPLST